MLAGHEGLPREIGKFLMKEKVLDMVSKNPDIALKEVVEQSKLPKLKSKVVELLKGIKEAAEEESKAAAEAGAVAEEPATVKTITKIIEAFTQKVETYDDINKLMSVKDVLRFFKKNYQKLNGSADKKIESINQLTKILDDTTTNKKGLELLRELFEELGKEIKHNDNLNVTIHYTDSLDQNQVESEDESSDESSYESSDESSDESIDRSSQEPTSRYLYVSVSNQNDEWRKTSMFIEDIKEWAIEKEWAIKKEGSNLKVLNKEAVESFIEMNIKVG